MALAPNDPRLRHARLNVSDTLTYHYVVASPEDKMPSATVLLLHGWPDLGMGWRFQVPYLLSLGLRVIVPDMLGYGQTSAPDEVQEYSLRQISAHMVQIIGQVTDEPVILGAHDWGALLAWRLAIYHPEHVRALFSFCIPFFPPTTTVASLEQVIKISPILYYQLQNVSGDVEEIVGKRDGRLRSYLNAMFGGVTPEGLPGFDPAKGIIEERLDAVQASPLVDPEIMNYYVQEFSRHGLRGPMNWYRARDVNREEELPLANQPEPHKFKVPAMIVMAGQDAALPASMLENQQQYFAAGLETAVIVEASHWILIHTPEESNRFIGKFIARVLEQP